MRCKCGGVFNYYDDDENGNELYQCCKCELIEKEEQEREIYCCEVCGRDENEVFLLQYPFTTVFKGQVINHVGEGVFFPEKEPWICIWCLHKDVEEVDE